MTAVLDRAGYPWRGIDKPEAAEIDEPEDGWSGAVICSGEDPIGAFLLCRHLRKREVPLAPVMVVVPLEQLGELELREDLFDDLCLEPVNADELSARLAHLFWRTGRGLRPDLLEHGPLVLNLETYQAAVAGKVLDLTYMEYELLRFLAARPGKVFTRETLLSRVWGYEYYGGRPHRRRPRPAAAGQAGRGARPPDPDGALGRLPVRPDQLDALSRSPGGGHAGSR